MTYGGLADAQGNVYELSNTLILMTSNIGENEAKRLSCKCLEMDCSMSAAAMEAIHSMDHECDILPFQRMVR
jgi:ATP-dependent Clp protease ATP-binding subunit ClpA